MSRGWYASVDLVAEREKNSKRNKIYNDKSVQQIKKISFYGNFRGTFGTESICRSFGEITGKMILKISHVLPSF
jgi:hypothetical protein